MQRFLTTPRRRPHPGSRLQPGVALRLFFLGVHFCALRAQN
jgi:hypothetical protein